MTTVSFRSKKSAAGVVAALRSDEHAPISAMIEIADRCNEVCVHCYQVQGQKGEMTTTEVKKVIDDLAQMGVLFLTLSGGEATLRPDFLDIVAHARERKFAVKLYTNGLTMTEKLANALAELAVQEVQISLYSHRADIHDWVTGVRGAFEKTVRGAQFLLQAGVPVVLKSPLMSFNVDEYREYIDFVQGLGADYALDPHIDPREDGDRSPEALRIDEGALLGVLRDEAVAGPHAAQAAVRSLEQNVCGACSGSVHIESNGEIRPCTQLTVPVGSAIEEGVAAAWSRNENAQVIRQLTWGDLHGCRDCDLREYCGRCFANAQREAGDALGPYASACRRAQLQYEVVHGKALTMLRTAERDARVGPYREASPGVFRASADRISEADRQLAHRFRWVRPGADEAPDMPQGPAKPGALVQIRRPGRRRARLEKVPGRQ